ncbi:MAG TPA: ABC transporter ATP-binding protein [Variovorax sp.]
MTTGAPVCLEIDALHLALRAGWKRAARLVLRGISLRIRAGEVHALVGESGAGKSMVGRTVLGIAPPEMEVMAGGIRFQGLDWLGLSAAARRVHLGRDIALIPQDPLSALNPGHTIGAQIADVLALHLGLRGAQARSRALELLDAVQIRAAATVLRQYPHELSGGMRQRVLIAIAFACKPKLIIADEPTTALDVTVQRQVLRLLRELQRNEGAAVLFITHNLGLVAKLCDSVSVIHSGRIIEQGGVASIIDEPRTPYTRALFAATPRYDRPAEALRPIDTEVTDALWAEAKAYDLTWWAARGAARAARRTARG